MRLGNRRTRGLRRFGGRPRKLLDLGATGTLTFCSSDVLFAELRGVLHRPKFALLLTTAVPPATPLTVMLRHQAITTLVTSEPIERTVPSDADDAVSMLAPIAIAVNATVAELLEEPAPTKSRTRRGPTPA